MCSLGFSFPKKAIAVNNFSARDEARAPKRHWAADGHLWCGWKVKIPQQTSLFLWTGLSRDRRRQSMLLSWLSSVCFAADVRPIDRPCCVCESRSKCRWSVALRSDLTWLWSVGSRRAVAVSQSKGSNSTAFAFHAQIYVFLKFGLLIELRY